MIGTRDIFVVAGSHREYENLLAIAWPVWDKEGLKKEMVHYVYHPDDLDGVHGARVFLYGTYFKRPDYSMIERRIAEGGNRSLLIR